MRLFKISDAVKAVCNKRIAMAEDGVVMLDTYGWHKVWRDLRYTATWAESMYMSSISRNASHILKQYRRVLAQSNALNVVLNPDYINHKSVLAQSNALNVVLNPEYLNHTQNQLGVLSTSSNNGTPQSYALSCAQSCAQSNNNELTK